MTNFKQLLTLGVMGAAATLSAHAQPVKITGTIDTTIQTNGTSPHLLAQGATASRPTTKRIKLLRVQLSSSAKKALHKNLSALKNHQSIRSTALKSTTPLKAMTSVQLGMNNVPVLDQGQHGSCVTFANTGAVDALLHKGDYISQLCQLSLGKTFEQYGFMPSGWNGSWGHIVLNQMQNFGIVSKTSQKKYGCGGMNKYPVNRTFDGMAMSLKDYSKQSEDIQDEFLWEPVAATLSATDKNGYNPDELIRQVKFALQHGQRVTFGEIVLVNHGFAGATGTYKTENDTWTLSMPIVIDILTMSGDFAGHEMIITGYDDNAIVTDEEDMGHRGVFTVRNSWGDDVGNAGTFYITYDYFKYLTMEAQRVEPFVYISDKKA